MEGVEVIRDDIIVMGFGETQEQAVLIHDESLCKLLERVCKVNLGLNSRMIKLRKSEMKFMGYIIGKQGLKPDPAKVKTVEDMPQYSCKQEVLSLLRFVNYLSRFLPRLADIAQPLRELPSKHTKLMGAKEPDTAFKEVKRLVVNYPILKYYDCNASKKGLGTVILQNGKPVAFALKTLLPTKRRYTKTEMP